MNSVCQSLVLVLGLVIVQVYGNLPSIEKNIEKETKAAGQEGMLNCTILNKGTNKVIWQKLARQGKPIEHISTDTQITTNNPKDSTKQEKYRVLVERKSAVKEIYTLAIRRLQDLDTGMYECYLLVLGEDEDQYPRALGELVVQLPPSIRDSAVTTTVQVAVGDTAVLKCDADGVPEPRISWSRANGMSLPMGGTTFYGKELRIVNATSMDRGAYRCKAENDVKPPGMIDVTLDVFYRPVLMPFRKTVGQAPGRNYEVRLSCRVSGNPEPVARWIRVEGQKRGELQDSEKYGIDKLKWLPGTNMKVGDYWYELIIRNVGDGDAGEYQCEASNSYGSGDAVVQLFMTTTCQTWKCWQDTDTSGAHGNVVSIVTSLVTIVMAMIFSRR